MATTLEELKERIANRLDEATIIETLQITAEELVERFEDKIDDRFDRLCADLFSEEDEDTETQTEV